MTATTTTTAPAATDTFAPEAPVTIALPGGRNVEGRVVLDEGGAKIEVCYLTGKGEKFTEVRRSTVSAREVAPVDEPAADEVPVRDIADVMDEAAAAYVAEEQAAEVAEVEIPADETPEQRIIRELTAQLAQTQAQLAAKKKSGKVAAEKPEWPADKPAILVSEPPSAERTQRRCPVDFPRVAAEIRKLNGAWAEILEAADKATSAQHVANRIRHSRIPGEVFGPAGAFESKAVGTEVFARYVGTGE
jgi:hypothetical protein